MGAVRGPYFIEQSTDRGESRLGYQTHTEAVKRSLHDALRGSLLGFSD